MDSFVWSKCLEKLQDELPLQQFNTWIRPLEVEDTDHEFRLLAPNRFVRDWVNEKYLERIKELYNNEYPSDELQHLMQGIDGLSSDMDSEALPFVNKRIVILIGSRQYQSDSGRSQTKASNNGDLLHSTVLLESTQNHFGGGNANKIISETRANQKTAAPSYRQASEDIGRYYNTFNRNYTFEKFVEGKSNQLAKAAAIQVAQNPGKVYNPLFLYGGVGLGKTHLMHAVGRHWLDQNPDLSVVILSSERFVGDMIKAIQMNAMDEFKRFYRSADALLIDDIQFFAGKERSQEEFFHTFNALLESDQQIILTCDRYPKEINGLEERLKSRFGWGLTVAVEPPELETRVAILMKKAEQSGIELSPDVAFFVAKKIRSNVRELEGALRRVNAHAQFVRQPVTIELVKAALKDLLAIQDRQVSIDNIQKTIAEYYKIKLSDLLSKRRNRSVARPRQMAMALSKELTNRSLPEIGEAFGGRDHTTVLHGHRKIQELRMTDPDIEEDYKNLSRLLTT